MKLRVWWNRNGKNTYYSVNSIHEAEIKLSELSYDDLEDNKIIYNAGGLEIFEDDKWSEYYNDEGLDIDEIMEENGHANKRFCPRCKKWYDDYPALSRKDNKTYICSDCGMEEAMLSFADSNGNGSCRGV